MASGFSYSELVLCTELFFFSGEAMMQFISIWKASMLDRGTREHEAAAVP